VRIYAPSICLAHDTGPEHPEAAWRLEHVPQVFARLGLEVTREVEPASLDALHRVHAAEYVASVLAQRGRWGAVDRETPLSPQSVDAALAAAGACVALVDELMGGPHARGAAIVRPPGHHAEFMRGMGFCVFNNVAVAAAHALSKGAGRVAVLDWDVHHGNGTQEIFDEDPRVLFLSVHQAGLFPDDTGWAHEAGQGAGLGATLNVPLAAGGGDDLYMKVMREAFLPALSSYKPALLLISAGFDAHERDPLGEMRVTDAGFGAMCAALHAWASEAGAPMGLVLEGGYDSLGLAGGLEACLRAMA
jgi:acetoin utilization deacetylase AcuC-like enzyme